MKKGLDALDGTHVLAPDSPLNPLPITSPPTGRGGPTNSVADVLAGGDWARGFAAEGADGIAGAQESGMGVIGGGGDWAGAGGIHVVMRKSADAGSGAGDPGGGDRHKAGAILAATPDGNRRQLVVNDLMQPLTVTVGGQAVTAEWSMRPVPPADLELLIGLAQQEASPPGGGRGGPAATQP